MKKIIFFTEPNWAFGNIHNSLSRILYSRNYLCDILNWSISRDLNDMNHIIKSVDFFVTMPPAVNCLISYGIPYEKIIIVAHGEIDILSALKSHDISMFEKVHKYAVIGGEWLKNKSLLYGIKRIPDILHIGIDEKRYYQEIPTNLNTVGFGGYMSVKDFFGNEIKRGDLVRKCCEITNLKFVENGSSVIHYTGMPSFYKSVDCIVMSSTQETVGLPMMEGAAAGRLVIGTEVGINSIHNNSIIVPVDEREFIKQTSFVLSYFKNNPQHFREKCLQQQQYALTHYKWENFVDEWVNFLQ